MVNLPQFFKSLRVVAILENKGRKLTCIKQRRTNDWEYKKWWQANKEAGCRYIEEFKTMPARDLYDAFAVVSSRHPMGFCNAVYDENFTAQHKNAPCSTKILCSLTSEDVMPLLLYLMCRYLAYSQRKGGVDTYAYFFKRKLPGDNKGAWHGSDLLYLYGGGDYSLGPFSPAKRSPSDTNAPYPFHLPPHCCS